MRLRTLDFLVCPIYKNNLEILIWEYSNNEFSESDLERIHGLGLEPGLFEKEIKTGALINRNQKIYYPIYNGVPRLLTYECGVFEEFKIKYSNLIARDLDGLITPILTPPKGEQSVIKSFSKEWLEYDWNPDKYWKISSEMMFMSMKCMLDIENKPIEGKNVLEVGIGIGGIANYFAKEEKCELVGIDLGYAVDAAYKNFKGNIFLHIIQASAFCLPLRENWFDYVYSQGVLHHSSDPKKCFINVSKMTKPNGYFYVWLYNNTNEYRNLIRSLIMIMEKIFRPLIWPMPSFMQDIVLVPFAFLYIIHQNFLLSKDKKHVKYSWREAIHAARDRFTPRYAYRYSEEEISNWFKEAGYKNLLLASERSFLQYLDPNFNLATVIIGQKNE